MVSGTAIIITGELFDSVYAKTAHGLVRGSDRFTIVGVIDEKSQGKDAGEVLDGKNRNIPIYASVSDFINSGKTADYAIIGVATKGGVIPDSMRKIIGTAIEQKINIVNGLHEHMNNIPALVSLATKHGVELIDIRKPKPFGEAKFWSGGVMEITCPKIAVLGTDCALGKRTTTRFITEDLQQKGINAQMIYTGQTGWMQGAKHGFIFDATLNDFISGEIEAAMVACFREENPDLIVIEGQSSLRNPSGPCGSEFIISGRLDGVVLQHNPARKHYKDMEYYPDLIAQPKDEIELIRILGAPTLAVTLNTKGFTLEEAKEYQQALEKELGIPVILPLEEGVDRLSDILKKLIKSNK